MPTLQRARPGACWPHAWPAPAMAAPYDFVPAPQTDLNRIYRIDRVTGEVTSCQYGLQEGTVGVTLCFGAGRGRRRPDAGRIRPRRVAPRARRRRLPGQLPDRRDEHLLRVRGEGRLHAAGEPGSGRQPPPRRSAARPRAPAATDEPAAALNTSSERSVACYRRRPFSRPRRRGEPRHRTSRPAIKTMKLNDPTPPRRALPCRRRMDRRARSIRSSNPATGEIVARVPRFGAAEATAAPSRRRERRLPALVEEDRQGALGDPAPLVRPDHRQPGRPRAHHDERAGQAARRGARRGRVRRLLRRVLCRGGEARLRRDDPEPPGRRAHRRDAPADRRRRRDHALEFPGRHDHAQGRAGARRRLHRGRQAGARDAADRAGARRARRAGRHSGGRAQHHHRQRRRRSATS